MKIEREALMIKRKLWGKATTRGRPYTRRDETESTNRLWFDLNSETQLLTTRTAYGSSPYPLSFSRG